MRLFNLLLLGCSLYFTTNYAFSQTAAQESIQLFRGKNRTNGTQLWQTDNTDKGTRINEYLSPVPSANSAPYLLGTIGKLALFSAFNPETGRELWRTDGTSQGTQLVRDLWQGAESALEDSTQTITFNGQLLFWSHHSQALKLMRTDGTANGTQEVATFPAGEFYAGNALEPSFTLLANQVYFWVDDGKHGLELWRNNGKTTELVLDATQEQGGYAYAPATLQTSQALYFSSPKQRRAQDNHSGDVLWQVTDTNVTPLHEVAPNVFSSLLAVDAKHLIWLQQANTNAAQELWVLNLQTKQARKVWELPQSEKAFLISKAYWSNGQLYWWMENRNNTEWWHSDLTAQGTQRLLLEPYQNGEYKGFPECFSLKQQFYCFTKDGSHPSQLWLTNGTSQSTRKLWQDTGGTSGDAGDGWLDKPNSYVAIGDYWVFSSFSKRGKKYLQLWSLSTKQPNKIVALGDFIDPLLLRPSVNNGTNSLQFISNKQRWQTDGTLAGTKTIGIEPSRMGCQEVPCFSGNELQVLAFNTKKPQWLLANQDSQAGKEPWLLNAKTTFSQLLKDINPLPADSHVANIKQVGKEWYFIMGTRLWWKTTPRANAKVVVGIPTNEKVILYGSHNMTVADNVLYVMTEKELLSHSLWRVEQGVARRLTPMTKSVGWLYPAQQGVYLVENSFTKGGYNIQHWQQDQLVSETSVTGRNSKSIMNLMDTSQGLLLLLKQPFNLKANNTQDAQELWWQASLTSKPQLLTASFKSRNRIDQTLLQTNGHLYTLQDSSLDQYYQQPYQLNHIDLKQKRLVPVANMPVLSSRTHIKAARHGLYILTGDNAPRLLYLADGQTQPLLIKQFSEKQNVELAQTQGDALYFNIQPFGDYQEEHNHLWITYGTAQSTRLIKNNVAME